MERKRGSVDAHRQEFDNVPLVESRKRVGSHETVPEEESGDVLEPEAVAFEEGPHAECSGVAKEGDPL